MGFLQRYLGDGVLCIYVVSQQLIAVLSHKVIDGAGGYKILLGGICAAVGVVVRHDKPGTFGDILKLLPDPAHREVYGILPAAVDKALGDQLPFYHRENIQKPYRSISSC